LFLLLMLVGLCVLVMGFEGFFEVLLNLMIVVLN
jgi:hypothetical protein